MAGDKKLATVVPLPGQKRSFAPSQVPDPTYYDDWQELERFCTSPETVEVLRYLAPKLREERLLTVLDGLTLVGFCEDYADGWRARKGLEAIRAKGQVPASLSKGGAVKRHPLVEQLDKACDRVDRGILHLGLSPAARAKLKAPNGQGDLFGADPIAQLLEQVHGSGRGLPANSGA